jgi:hypothetical protein
MSPEETVQVLESAEVAYDVAMRRLDEQMRQIDAIDNKIAVIVGASSAVATLFAGFVSVAAETESTLSLWMGIVFIALAVCFYVPAILFGMRAYGFYEWEIRPNWDDLLLFAVDYPDQVMRSWVAGACVASLKENSSRISSKLEYAGRSTWFLVCETLAAAGGVLAMLAANAAN